jgi:GT2 family glycosyltransferase
LDVLREKGLATEFVLFIDGDCTLQPGFVAAAMAHMRDHSKAGAVAGRRREAGSGFWSRLIDIEWDTPVGPTDGVGGDSLMRWRAIEEAGGWPVTVIAGEEPDLCLRMKDAGWECYRLPIEMTLHDIRMTRFGQYWKRCVRAGHAYAEVAWRRRRGSRSDRARSVASIALYAFVLPAAAIAALVAWWPAVVLPAFMYLRLVIVVSLRTRRRRLPFGLSLANGVLTLVGKYAAMVGVLRFLFGALSGRRSSIIEYQVASPLRVKEGRTP